MKKITFLIVLLTLFIVTSCNVVFNPAGYTMNIKQGSVNIAHKSGKFDFGSVDVFSSSQAIEFTIENLGVTPLTLSATPIVQISGTNFNEFSVDSSLTIDLLEAGENTSFFVTFNPTSAGSKSAKISIANSTISQNPYTYTITGTANPIVETTEINVKQGTDDIPNTTGRYEFGSINVGFSSPAIEFTIENLGNSDLNLTGNPFKIVTNSGDAFMFVIDQLTSISPIPGGSATTFTVTFRPSSQGVKSTTIVIPNNDEDENPYIFTVSGSGAVPIVAPEINVKQGSANIANTTGSHDFGSVPIGESGSAVVFTIENLGNRDLLLTGNPNKIITNGGSSGMYVINQTTTNTPVPAGFTTTFSITFKPTAEGVKSTTIVISNNDSDENPYTFSVTGTCTVPEINIKQDTTDVPNITGTYDFGDIGVNQSSPDVEFTIESLGNAPLKLTGTPKIRVNGADSGMFSVNQTSTTTPITQGNSTTFSVTFNPTATGIKNAIISIANNDQDENPYTFNVTGKGVVLCTAIGWIGGASNGWKTGVGAAYAKDLRSFYLPSSVVTDSAGNIYVADTYNHRISKWDSSGNAIGWIGGGSNGWKTGTAPNSGNDYKSFYSPTSLFIYSGYIYVTESFNNRVSKWDISGNAIGWIGGGSDGWKTTSGANYGSGLKSFRYPYSVSVDTSGNIFVVDYYNNRISKWNAAGTAIGWIGSGSNGWKTGSSPQYGTDYQSFRYPRGISLDTTGNIYVADMYNNRISKWSASGNAIGWIGGGSNGWKTSSGTTNGNDYQSFYYPRALFVDSAGTIYISDSSNSRICKWDSAGNAIGWIGGTENGWKTTNGRGIDGGYQGFYYPTGIFVDSSKQIFIADTYHYRICKWQD